MHNKIKSCRTLPHKVIILLWECFVKRSFDYLMHTKIKNCKYLCERIKTNLFPDFTTSFISWILAYGNSLFFSRILERERLAFCKQRFYAPQWADCTWWGQLYLTDHISQLVTKGCCTFAFKWSPKISKWSRNKGEILQLLKFLHVLEMYLRQS